MVVPLDCSNIQHDRWLRLLAAGNALAHSVGHHPSCPKASPQFPCMCFAAKEQAKALDDWYHLAKEVQDAEKG